jgi:hypothetical protein
MFATAWQRFLKAARPQCLILAPKKMEFDEKNASAGEVALPICLCGDDMASLCSGALCSGWAWPYGDKFACTIQ